jgi:predicted ATP-grasp superfamily ATP-dependent carboligase
MRATWDEAAMSSRFVSGVIPLSEDTPEDEWVEQLISLRPSRGRAVLLAIDDLAAVTVSDHQERLAEYFTLPANPAGLQRRLASKRALWELCQALDLPAPESSFPVNEEELLKHVAATGYPVVLKRAETWFPSRDPAAPSVAIARTEEQLLAAYARMESDVAPQVMVQEYIPGEPDSVWMFNGYFGAGGTPLLAITGQKLRQRGPRTGPTTLGIVRTNDEVVKLAGRLLGELGYRGIVDMGFRYDARDGRYKLLDVNPRLGSTFRLFVSVDGLDVVRAMHRDLSQQPVPQSRAEEGRIWIDERSDLATAARMERDGSLTLSAWARSLRGIDEAAWWAADDPRPFVRMVRQSAPRAVREVAASLTR